MAKKLVVIDGKSIFYRGYYAMPNLSTKDGTPTGGVYGFTVLALEVIKRLKPDYVCVAWDMSGTNIRSRRKIYPEYKAGRKKAPDDFYAQIPVLQELLKSLSWPFYEYDDYEADDIMATLAKKAEAQGIETVLISSDLDLLQSVTEMTSMFALKKGLSNIQEFTPKDFKAKYGVEVSQFVDLKALKGDSSDNIPGVMGVGEKTAVALLQEHGDLDTIYENIDLIKESVRKKLVKDKDMAYTSKELVKLMFDAPVDLELDKLDVSDLNVTKLKQDLRDLEFFSLINQLPESMDSGEALDESVKNVIVAEFKEPTKDLKPAALKDCAAIVSETKLYLLIEDDFHALDLDEADQVKALKDSGIFNEESLVISDSVKHLYIALAQAGVSPTSTNIMDTTLAAFIRNPLIRDHSIESLIQNFLQLDLDGSDDLTAEQQAYQELVAIAELAKNHKAFFDQPDNADLTKIYYQIDAPSIISLTNMQLVGMKLDAEYLNKMDKELTGRISDLEQTIYGHANKQFNIASPAQLSEVLFTDLELPTRGIKKGKTSYSTAASELAKLAGQHPIVDYIGDFRELSKLKSTYVEALPNHQDADGRIRSTLSQTVTSTGRLSSSDPNLQNIPVRTEVGKLIRNAFVAEEGNVIISADYSQFELRLAALLSGDTDMIEAFNKDIDIHTLTASQVFGVELDAVTKEQRYHAKTVNFGILYGQGAHALAQQTGMTYGEAKSFIERYFEKRSALKNYIKGLRELAKDQGYVATLYGRRRPTPDVESRNFAVRESAYRQAVNMPIQGTEADLMKMAMLQLDSQLDQKYGKFDLANWGRPKQIMQVHDSIMVECRAEHAEEISKLMVDVMESVDPALGIKLKVDCEYGSTWGDV